MWIAGIKKLVELQNSATGQQSTVTAEYIVNAAGLHAQEVASSLGEREQAIPRRYLAKGNYFTLEGEASLPAYPMTMLEGF